MTEHKKKVILITGKPRIGKSSIVNSLLQKHEAKVSHGTESVTLDAKQYNVGNYIFIDTPGLFALDTEMRTYWDTISYVRKLGFLSAVLVVVTESITYEDMVAAELLKIALLSPYNEDKNNKSQVPTHFIFNKIMGANREEYNQNLQTIKNQNKEKSVFGFQTINTLNQETIMKSMLTDSLFLTQGLTFYDEECVPNTLGEEMENRSFMLARAWLSDDKTLSDALNEIDFKVNSVTRRFKSYQLELKEWAAKNPDNKLVKIWHAVANFFFRIILDFSMKKEVTSKNDWTTFCNKPLIDFS